MDYFESVTKQNFLDSQKNGLVEIVLLSSNGNIFFG